MTDKIKIELTQEEVLNIEITLADWIRQERNNPEYGCSEKEIREVEAVYQKIKRVVQK